jgi:hypothetical protein
MASFLTASRGKSSTEGISILKQILYIAGKSVGKIAPMAAGFCSFPGMVEWAGKRCMHFAEHSGHNAI